MVQTDWYDTRIGKLFYWGILGATLIGVLVSILATEMQIPPTVYLFGFLGATVYAFTSFAKQFSEDGRYRLKIVSRTVAVFPLAVGVYLLAFAFPGVSGELSALASENPDVTATDRLVAGLVFLTGVYVSATLQALGGLAERLLGVSPAQKNNEDDAEGHEDDDERREESTAGREGEHEPSEHTDSNRRKRQAQR